MRHVTDTANDTGGSIGVGIANAATTVAPRGKYLIMIDQDSS